MRTLLLPEGLDDGFGQHGHHDLQDQRLRGERRPGRDGGRLCGSDGRRIVARVGPTTRTVGTVGQAGGEHQQPRHERQPDALDLGLGQAGEVGDHDGGEGAAGQEPQLPVADASQAQRHRRARCHGQRGRVAEGREVGEGPAGAHAGQVADVGGGQPVEPPEAGGGEGSEHRRPAERGTGQHGPAPPHGDHHDRHQHQRRQAVAQVHAEAEEHAAGDGQDGSAAQGAPWRRGQDEQGHGPGTDRGVERVGRGDRPEDRRGEHQERRRLAGATLAGHVAHGEEHGRGGGGAGHQKERGGTRGTAEADPVEADEEQGGPQRVALHVDGVALEDGRLGEGVDEAPEADVVDLGHHGRVLEAPVEPTVEAGRPPHQRQRTTPRQADEGGGEEQATPAEADAPAGQAGGQHQAEAEHHRHGRQEGEVDRTGERWCLELPVDAERDPHQGCHRDQRDPGEHRPGPGQALVRSRAVPDVVLPMLDEAAAIEAVLAAMPAGYRPIVVDNGSTDGSPDLARAAGALVVHEPERGFGSACWAGLLAATDDVVCFMDADGSLDPADLPLVADPVLAGVADLVLGERIATAGAWPAHARVANRFLAFEVRRRTDLALRDLGPLRAVRRQALLDLGMVDRRFGWPLEMVLRADRAGWRVAEVPVPYRPREGRSKVTGTVKGTVRTVRDMSRILRTT
ncbi:glycosyltransferase [Aquihabitans sp. G128]|nr:glycosyltransferase [Aquihabitans sp. G128]